MKRLQKIILLIISLLPITFAQQFDLMSVGSDNKIAQSPFFTISNNTMNLYANTNFSHPYAVATGDTFVVERQSSTTMVVEQNSVLKSFRLEQNYPNPFNMSTIVRYSVPEDADVMMKVYDITGREIATLVNTKQVAGTYSVGFGNTELSSGTYFYRMIAKTADGHTTVESKKMIVMK